MPVRRSALSLAAVVALASLPATVHGQAPVRVPTAATVACDLRSTRLRMPDGYDPFTDVVFAAHGHGETLLAGHATVAIRERGEHRFLAGLTIRDGTMLARPLGPRDRPALWPVPRAVVADRRAGWHFLWLHGDTTQRDRLGNEPFTIEVAHLRGDRITRQARRDTVRLFTVQRAETHAEGVLHGEPTSVYVGVRMPEYARVQLVLIRLSPRGAVSVDTMPFRFEADPVRTSLSVAIDGEFVVMNFGLRIELSEEIETVRWSARTGRWDRLGLMTDMPMLVAQSRVAASRGQVALAWEGRHFPQRMFAPDSIWGSVRDPVTRRWRHTYLMFAPQPTIDAMSFPDGSALLYIASGDVDRRPLLANFAGGKVTMRELTEQAVAGVAKFQWHRGDTLALWLVGPQLAADRTAPLKRVLLPRRCFG